MHRYFYLTPSPYYKNKYVIALNYDKLLFPNGTAGSCTVFIARIMNLSYDNYLRYVRDRLGAELIGKNSRYITPYFDNNEVTQAFIKLLNSRMEIVMYEQAHPYILIKNEDGSYTRQDF